MACRCQEFGETLLGYLEKDPSQSTGFKMPVINSKDKWRKFCWDGFVCCLLTGGPAVDALMASRSKYMDSSFAKKMGLGLSSVLEVNEGEFKKLVSDAFRRFDEDGSGTLELPEILEAFKTLPLESVSEADVEKKFEEFDEDDSGALDFDEFSALMRVLRQERTLEKFAEVPEEEFLELLKDSFKRFDADDSGELELEEIIQAFKTLPLKDDLRGPGARHVHAIRRRQIRGAGLRGVRRPHARASKGERQTGDETTPAHGRGGAPKRPEHGGHGGGETRPPCRRRSRPRHGADSRLRQRRRGGPPHARRRRGR